MKNQKLQRLYYKVRHQYLTTNNLVIAVALFIAASWAYGSIGVIQRNYNLQREIAAKQRQLTLVELETETLKFQQKYYKSDEYKELAVRQRLGLVFPGEKVLILPPNTEAAKELDSQRAQATRTCRSQPTHSSGSTSCSAVQSQ